MSEGASSPSRPKQPFTDTRSIDLESRGELEFWLKVLDTNKEDLEAAIAAVGPYAGAVAIYLRSLRADPRVTGAESPRE